MKTIRIVLAIFTAILTLSSCTSGKSYAQLLAEENIAINAFLANNRVIPYEQRDSNFQYITGADAPYYEIDPEGALYMQVLYGGTPGYRAQDDQLIYFRFTRYNLEKMENGELPEGEGNDSDMSYGSYSFRFNNSTNSQSVQWGSGIQSPLLYLPLDCEVNLIVKSQYGLYSEIANVVPYLYNIRYFKSQI